MNKTCLIVDDEPVARGILRKWCKEHPSLEVVGECENGIEAIAFLQRQPVDLVFLDINMPLLDGMTFLRTLTNRPAVVLTTAYSEFALEAYDLDVADYLTKPITFDRFARAIQRVFKPETPKQAPPPSEFQGLALRFRNEVTRVPYSQVLFCESRLNNTHIFTLEEEHRVYLPLSRIVSQLPSSGFFRTHRSFVVNLSHVFKVEGNTINFGEHKVPIAARRQAALRQALGLT